jgi:4a-hydroxytetrahydrobiopterin dehydratase
LFSNILAVDIETFITKHPDWYEEMGFLVAGYEFADFAGVQAAVAGIMNIASEQDHHPEVTFGYNTILVRTVTHDAGNKITEKDFALAEVISDLMAG